MFSGHGRDALSGSLQPCGRLVLFERNTGETAGVPVKVTSGTLLAKIAAQRVSAITAAAARKLLPFEPCDRDLRAGASACWVPGTVARLRSRFVCKAAACGTGTRRARGRIFRWALSRFKISDRRQHSPILTVFRNRIRWLHRVQPALSRSAAQQRTHRPKHE